MLGGTIAGSGAQGLLCTGGSESGPPGSSLSLTTSRRMQGGVSGSRAGPVLGEHRRQGGMREGLGGWTSFVFPSARAGFRALFCLVPGVRGEPSPAVGGLGTVYVQQKNPTAGLGAVGCQSGMEHDPVALPQPPCPPPAFCL